MSFWTVTGRGYRFTVTIYGVVLILLCLPIVSVMVPPLGDYPNHLARMHILATYADSPALQTNYVVAWKLSPYLGMDLLVPLLTHFMSIYTAGRAFLCLCLILFVAGTAAINTALFGKLTPWPAASALFGYSYVFSLGFANYLFGVGIWLLAFAGWIVLSRGPTSWRVCGGMVLSLSVFFSHFFAFFGYGICVAGYELGIWLASRDRTFSTLLRRVFAAGCTFILPLAIVASVPRGQEGGITRYGSLSDKINVLLSPAMFPGARFDLVIYAMVAALIVGGLLLGKLRIAAQMRVTLAVLAAVTVVMPNLLSGVWAMDDRFPVVLMYLIIASSEWAPMRAPVAGLMTCFMLLLLALNIDSIVKAWQPIGAQYDELRAALRVIEPGARVIAFREDVGIDHSLKRGTMFQYGQLPALAVIERDAFLPFLFKNPMMPVAAAPRVRAIDTPHGHSIALSDIVAGSDPIKGPMMLGEKDTEGRRNFWGDWPHHYDYAIDLNFGAKTTLPDPLKLLKSGLIFGIYRVVP